MPLAAGDLIVSTFGRHILVVAGADPAIALGGAFRALSLGHLPTEVRVTNTDVDASFTWFKIAFAAQPAGKPKTGSRVRVFASPLSYTAGVPVTSNPITMPSMRGIIYAYFTIPVFPGPIYAGIFGSDQSFFLCQQDELSLDNTNLDTGAWVD